LATTNWYNIREWYWTYNVIAILFDKIFMIDAFTYYHTNNTQPPRRREYHSYLYVNGINWTNAAMVTKAKKEKECLGAKSVRKTSKKKKE